MPFGGVNGTLEALDMAVPVVTLCGRKHGERTSYSILANLGVLETVANSGPEYVDSRRAPGRRCRVRCRGAVAHPRGPRALGADRHAGAYPPPRGRLPASARALYTGRATRRMKDASRRLQRARQDMAQGRVAAARDDGRRSARERRRVSVCRAGTSRPRRLCPAGEAARDRAAPRAGRDRRGSRGSGRRATSWQKCWRPAATRRARRPSLADAVRLAPAFTQAWFYLGILEGEQRPACRQPAARVRDGRAPGAPSRPGVEQSRQCAAQSGPAARRSAGFRACRRSQARLRARRRQSRQDPARHRRGRARRGRAARGARASHAQIRRTGRWWCCSPGLTRERGLFDEVATALLARDPGGAGQSSGEWYNLGWVLGERGDTAQAREAFARAFALDRRELRGLCGQHLALPIVHASRAESRRRASRLRRRAR